MIEEMLGIPVVGTIPYLELDFKEEKSSTGRKPHSIDLGDPQKIEKELNKLAHSLRENLDMDYVYRIMDLESSVR
jgi:adenosylcobyric acid synthase